MKTISPNERLIVALDVPDPNKARALVRELSDAVLFYKVGMELCTAAGFIELIHWLKKQQKHIFVDLKFFDIPETVGRAVSGLAAHGVDFCTVHGNQSIMEAAASSKHGSLKVLAVTALTSLDRGDLQDLGFKCDVEDLVLSRAKRALEAGCDGVVSSGLEVSRLRAEAPSELIVVVPGIRPVDNKKDGGQIDDQKRIMTPAEAIAAGADYLVVGRPIRDAGNPRAVAKEIQTQIQGAIK